jgi:CDP-glucose 4,6-dehydratase
MEVFDKIRDLMKCNHIKATVLNQAKREIRSQYLCSEKAKRVLGWKVTYSLDEGLKETINWYKNFLQGECG